MRNIGFPRSHFLGGKQSFNKTGSGQTEGVAAVKLRDLVLLSQSYLRAQLGAAEGVPRCRPRRRAVRPGRHRCGPARELHLRLGEGARRGGHTGQAWLSLLGQR